jgi:hypothetical protein
MRINKRQVQLLPKHPVGTLPGFGWLREAPRPANVALRAKVTPEQMEKHAALRKCLYFPAMDPATRPASFKSARAADRVITSPDLFRPPLRKRNTPESLRRPPYAQASTSWTSRFEDPVSVGILLAIVPPLGFMMLWGSPRYSRDAKMAITALMTVFMVLGTAALCTLLITMR